MKLTYEVDRLGNKRYLNAKGQRHRTDAPAIEYADGSKYWYLNDELHRTDGPAVEYADGSKYWYLNGEPLTEAQFNERTKPVVKLTVDEIADKILTTLVSDRFENWYHHGTFDKWVTGEIGYATTKDHKESEALIKKEILKFFGLGA